MKSIFKRFSAGVTGRAGEKVYERREGRRPRPASGAW
jgi:hypothetical protein